jgi:hypothetical protein
VEGNSPFREKTEATTESILKKVTVTTLSIVLALFATGTAFAATSATANATANIVTAIGITKSVDLQFGNVVSSTGATFVILSTAGVRTGDAILSTGGTGASAASFAVSGDAGSTYAITLPTTATLTTTPGAETMTVDTFNSNPTGTGTLTLGSQNLLVGATLHVGAGQVSGAYAGTFNVSVAYN